MSDIERKRNFERSLNNGVYPNNQTEQVITINTYKGEEPGE